MATIIPNYCNSESEAEKMIFNMFRDNPQGTSDWIILHSQNVKRFAGEPQIAFHLNLKEIDFLILIPNCGMILLEVKGGRISTDNYELYSIDKGGVSHRIDPVKQIKDAAHSLKECLEKNILDESGEIDLPIGLVYDTAIIFPQSPSPVKKLGSLDEIQIIDSVKIRNFGLVECIQQLSKRVQRPGRFTRVEIDKILKLLKPSVDPIISIGTRIGQSEAEIITATDEQYIQLDNAELNNGLIVTGAAGTGKTTLASELFRRSVSLNRKTAFFCYNKLLGNKLARDHLSKTLVNPECKVGTIHSVMYEWISNSSFIKELKSEEKKYEMNQDKLLKEIFPALALKAVKEKGIKFDHIILDEAQDILSPAYIKLLNAICDKGLAEGRWTFFGDFIQQAIYGNITLTSAIDDLKSETLTRPAISNLHINCRNSKQIATETAKVSGFSRAPSEPKNTEGTEVSFAYFNKIGDQAEIVKTEIGKLLQAGLKYNDIVVLSTRRLKSSGAIGADSSGSFDLVDVTENDSIKLQSKQVAFSTIHAFKGMEAVAVIICDLDSVKTDEANSIIYVGMSRAKSHLVVLADNKIRDTIVQLRNRNLTK